MMGEKGQLVKGEAEVAGVEDGIGCDGDMTLGRRRQDARMGYYWHCFRQREVSRLIQMKDTREVGSWEKRRMARTRVGWDKTRISLAVGPPAFRRAASGRSWS